MQANKPNSDYGSIIMVQTNNGTLTNVHRRVLDQNPGFKKMWNDNLRRGGNPSVNTLRWSSASGFGGMSKTYIHWLYNGNLPTAVIDVSNERNIGAVLLRLAEEYTLGCTVSDGLYQNDIMDAFITLHVRSRKLASRSVIEVAYDDINEWTPMRQMLADMHAFIVADDIEKLDLLDDMPKAFVVDVLESVVTLRPNEADEWWHFLKETGKTYHV